MANVIKKVKIGTTDYDIHAKTADSATSATNATNATKATQDSAGQQINTTYIKGLSVSGKTITYTKGDGSTGTITTQDTNTTYGAATSSALGLIKSGTDITVDSSGNVSVNDDSHNHVISNVDGLQSALDGKSATGHTHDDRYYTESEIDSKLSGKADSSHTHSYLPLSGGQMTDSIITPKNDNMGIIPNTNNYGQIGSSDKKFYRMYATTFYGALSGNASTATALSSSAGSATQPVYFSEGKPVATTYTLGKSVPSDAVFTDTITTNVIVSATQPTGQRTGDFWYKTV